MMKIKVKKRLNEIDVLLDQGSGQVTAKTLFEKKSNNNSLLSNLFGGSSNVNMEDQL